MFLYHGRRLPEDFPEENDDRAPTLEEIRKLCDYPDRRIRPLVYTMVSSGIRVGAWDYLRWGNVRPVEQGGKIVAARILVYADEDDSYVTYITPSAYRELAEWMNYREGSGEIITGTFKRKDFLLRSRISKIIAKARR